MLGIEREGLAELLCDPRTGPMCRDVEMENTSAVMGDDKEAVQHPEGESCCADIGSCVPQFLRAE